MENDNDAPGILTLLKPGKGLDAIVRAKIAPEGYILTQKSSGHVHWVSGECDKEDCYRPELDIDLKECIECGCTKDHDDNL